MKHKPELCKADAVTITQLIVALMNSGNLTAADPQNESMLECLSMICVCLKEEFYPFLSTLVPRLKQDMEKDVKFSVRDADDVAGGDDEGDDQVSKMAVKIKGMEGTKQISMDTSALEAKTAAITVMKDIARNMGTKFYDFVETVAELLLGQLMNDRLTQEVRHQSAKCMRFCVAACEDHPERQKALFIMSYIKLNEEFDFYLPKEDFDSINPILKEIHKHLRCLHHLRDKNIQIFTEEDAKTLVDRMKAVIDLIQKDKKERVEKIKSMKSQLDEEDMEYFMEDLEKVDKAIHHVMEIIGVLMQNQGRSDVISDYVGS